MKKIWTILLCQVIILTLAIPVAIAGHNKDKGQLQSGGSKRSRAKANLQGEAPTADSSAKKSRRPKENLQGEPPTADSATSVKNSPPPLSTIEVPVDPRYGHFLPLLPRDVKGLIFAYLDGKAARSLNEVCWDARNLVRLRGRLIFDSPPTSDQIESYSEDITTLLKTLIIKRRLDLKDCQTLSFFILRCPNLASLSLSLPILEEMEDEGFDNVLEVAKPIEFLLSGISLCSKLKALSLSDLDDYSYYFMTQMAFWKNFPNLSYLDLALYADLHDNDGVRKKFISSLARLPNLTSLQIKMSGPDQDEVDALEEALSNQSELRSFSCEDLGGDVLNSYESFIPLLKRNPDLRCLAFEGCIINMEFSSALASLRNLNKFSVDVIDFSHNEVFTAEDVEKSFLNALKSLSQLKELKFAYYKGHQEGGVCSLPLDLPSLRKVIFSSSHFTYSEIVHFLKLRNLKRLMFKYGDRESTLTPRASLDDDRRLEIVIYGEIQIDEIDGRRQISVQGYCF